MPLLEAYPRLFAEILPYLVVILVANEIGGFLIDRFAPPTDKKRTR